mgnify:CR=1 FL=1
MLRLLIHALAVMAGLEGPALTPQLGWTPTVPVSVPVPAADLGPAELLGDDVLVDRSRVLRLNGDVLYPFDPSVKEVDLVIFWPWLGYGPQRMVLEHERYGVAAALSASGIDPHGPSQVLVLVVKEPRRAWKRVAQTIERLRSEHGVRVVSKTLGCWSGGASGASTALNADEDFVGWFMADPSPSVARRRAWPKDTPLARVQTIEVWRNSNNWGSQAGPGGYYRRDITHFLEAVEQLGGESTETTRHHKELLFMGMTAAIKAARSASDLTVYDAVSDSNER